MATLGPPLGRERRRTDLYGRVRRFLYGILLLAASPGAYPTDEIAHVGRVRAPAAAEAQSVSLAQIQGLLVLHSQPVAGLPPTMTLDSVTAQVQDPGSGQAPFFRIAPRAEGGHFALPITDFGSFDLRLQVRTDPLHPEWSLAGSLHLQHTAEGAEHRAEIANLRITPGGNTIYVPFEVSLQQSRDAPDPELTFRWRV